MKTNKILVKLLTTMFVLTFFLISVYSGPPPGVTTDGFIKTEALSVENKTRFSLSIGSYKPNLSVLNEDLKYWGFDPIGSSAMYTIGVGKGVILPVMFNFSYWSGSSTKSTFFKETINMYIFDVSMNLWNIAKFFPKPYSEYFKLNLNFIVRDVFATLKDEYLSSDIYVLCTALALDLGSGVELEFFPFIEYKSFSVSLGLDHIFFSLPFSSFQVWDTNKPGVSAGDKYKSYNGKDITLETNGNILKFGINFYF